MHRGINPTSSKTPPPSFLPSPSIPSFLLRITKFLIKLFQFELLVMTEKNIFAYKLYFLCENCNPPWKRLPALSEQPPSKRWGPVKATPFENLVGGSTPPPPPPPKQKGAGVHTMHWVFFIPEKPCFGPILEHFLPKKSIVSILSLHALVTSFFVKNQSVNFSQNLKNLILGLCCLFSPINSKPDFPPQNHLVQVRGFILM